MKTTKGIFLDTAFNDTPPGYLTFAKNVLLTEKLGVIQNEQGFLEHASLPLPIIGVLPILNKVLYWMTDNTTSEIGYLENGVYTKVIGDADITPAGSKLNFRLEYPIKGEFHITALNEIVVAWVDDTNTPKIINITKPSFQANDLELFSSATLSTPQVSVLQTGGALKSGVVKIGYFYEDDDGSTSNYSTLSKPVSIIKATNTDNIKDVWGIAAGNTTNKAVKITVVDVDTNWTYINFFAVKTINSITTVALFKRLAISPNTNGDLETIYTGGEAETALTLAEVLTPKAFYKQAKAITQLNNKLYLGNLTTEDEVKLQKFALNITVKWRSILQPITAISKEASGTDGSTFAHGEVYALYLQVRDSKTGVWTKGFHIPGRAMLAGEDATVAPGPNASYVSGTGSQSFKKYQLDDTCTFTGTLTPGPYYVGNMGFWENQNETYPNTADFNGSETYGGQSITGGRDLRTEKVLHHKFPSINWMKKTVFPSNTNYGKTVLDKLTLDVDNIQLPAELAGKVSAWRIAYAKRDLNNATVLGTSGVFFFGAGSGSRVLKPVPINGSSVSTYSGIPPNHVPDIDWSLIISTDAPSGANNWQAGAEYIRFHAFNLLVDKPSVSPAYLRQEIQLQFSHDNTSDGLSDVDPRLLKDSLWTNTRKWELYDPNVQTCTASLPADIYKFRAVNFVQYLASNVKITENNFSIDNNNGEECLLLKHNITGISNATTKTLGLVGTWLTNMFYYKNTVQRNYLSSLLALKSDVYTSFTSQNLVATTKENILSAGSWQNQTQTNIAINTSFTNDLRYWNQYTNPNQSQTPGVIATVPAWGWSAGTALFSTLGGGGPYKWASPIIGQQGGGVIPGREHYIQIVAATNFSYYSSGLPTIYFHWLNGATVLTTESLSMQFTSGGYGQDFTAFKQYYSIAPAGATGWGFSTMRGADATYRVNIDNIAVSPLSLTFLNNALTDIGGGDNWQGYHSIHLQGPVDDNTETGGANQNLTGHGCKAVHYLLTECPKNLNYRYPQLGVNESAFYNGSELLPKVNNADYDTRYLGLMDLKQTPVYKYNQDYNTLADLGINLTASDPSTVTETGFPTTIASSIAQGAESNVINWKTFLIADRYTMPRNKGALINLQGVGNQRLFIHHEDSLFITKDRTVLKGNITDVTLGSGDIFEVTPFEVMSSDQGYAGTQHKMACTLTKLGYVFPDMSQGKWFIHNGDVLQEISKNGLRQFWRDHLDPSIGDNPFTGNGVSIVYDEVYNRLIFSVKDEINNKFITASYSPQLEAWCSYHDYDPNYLYATRGNKLYSVKTVDGISKIYLHNAGPHGRYYQGPEVAPYPMIVEMLHNDNAYDTKHFSAINWVTQATTPAGIEDKTDTWNFITGRTATKGTGKIQVLPYNRIEDSHEANTRLTEKSWNFNKLRNAVVPSVTEKFLLDFSGNFALNPAVVDFNKDWYEQGRIIDNYLAIRYEYSNLNNNKFLLLDHDVDTRVSIRS